MAYLQPWMWWALPAIFLPILIHLLNRLRYKTVHWAAMIFLLKANRAATRRAKLRQYLLLGCRMLVILFLLWAMARPIVGGWLGNAAGGAPETVLLLVDRSASMSTGSRLSHGLELLTQAARQSVGSRFVLIESVLAQPLEMADARALASLEMTAPTDTAADIPSMVRAALDYLVRNKPGSAEVWIASDLQASNWHPESAEWADLSARFQGLKNEVRVRVLDLSGPAGHNVSVALKTAEWRVREPGKSARLNLQLDLKSSVADDGIPLLITRDGVKSQVDLKFPNASVQRRNLPFELSKLEPGWGKVELPADDGPSDNFSYFVYAPPAPLTSALVGEILPAVRFAVSPEKARTDRKIVEVAGAAIGGRIVWAETAFIALTGPVSEPDAKALKTWVESGGVLLCFPSADANAGPLGITWAEEEKADDGRPLRVTAWDELDGPLARTDNGASLAMARLEISKRRVPNGGDDSTHAYGVFADGRPFLIGRKVGEGHVFACATRPEPAWSTLGDGLVLLPMTQRLLTLGGAHLSPPNLATAGEWKPADATEVWTSVEGRRDWRWQAGVYQSGTRRIALNRPESEDVMGNMDRARLPEILHGIKLTVLAGALELKADRLQSEIWPTMIVVMMVFMAAEMALATSQALLPARPGIKKPAMAGGAR